MVQPSGSTSNTSLPHLLISELQNWEAILKADPDVVRTLKSFEAVADPTQTKAKGPKSKQTSRVVRGPTP